MQVVQTNSFARALRRLHPTQKQDLDEAVITIMANPSIGELKVGDLANIAVYKFRMSNQLTLLAYTYDNGTITLTLFAFGAHENFYRDLKRQF